MRRSYFAAHPLCSVVYGVDVMPDFKWMQQLGAESGHFFFSPPPSLGPIISALQHKRCRWFRVCRRYYTLTGVMELLRNTSAWKVEPGSFRAVDDNAAWERWIMANSLSDGHLCFGYIDNFPACFRSQRMRRGGRGVGFEWRHNPICVFIESSRAFAY